MLAKVGRGGARKFGSVQCAASLILLLLCRCGLKDVVNYSVGKKSLAEQQYEDLLAVGNIVLQLACKSHTGSRGAQEQVKKNPSIPVAWFCICGNYPSAQQNCFLFCSWSILFCFPR